MFSGQRITGSIHTVPVGSILISRLQRKTLFQRINIFIDNVMYSFKRKNQEEEQKFIQDMNRFERELKEKNGRVKFS